MVNVIKQEVRMEEHLRKRLEFICEFCRVKPVIINGNLRTIDKTNLTYLEPHRIIINDITFLTFNYSNELFIENLNNKIKTLTENNEALNLRVKTLNDIIKEKDNEISFLKSKIHDLKNTLDYWKYKWYDRDDKYIDVVNDMYEDKVLNDEDIEELDLSKEKDGDLEL